MNLQRYFKFFVVGIVLLIGLKIVPFILSMLIHILLILIMFLPKYKKYGQSEYEIISGNSFKAVKSDSALTPRQIIKSILLKNAKKSIQNIIHYRLITKLFFM